MLVPLCSDINERFKEMTMAVGGPVSGAHKVSSIVSCLFFVLQPHRHQCIMTKTSYFRRSLRIIGIETCLISVAVLFLFLMSG